MEPDLVRWERVSALSPGGQRVVRTTGVLVFAPAECPLSADVFEIAQRELPALRREHVRTVSQWGVSSDGRQVDFLFIDVPAFPEFPPPVVAKER